MIPFLSATHVVNLVCSTAPERPALNADLAWAEANLPRPQARDRLAFVRTAFRSLWRRIEARRHERQLIKLWTISPHLLEDIGVLLDGRAPLEDHLVHAPKRVIEHLRAQGALPPEDMPQTAPKPAPKPAPTHGLPQAAQVAPHLVATLAAHHVPGGAPKVGRPAEPRPVAQVVPMLPPARALQSAPLHG